MGKPSKKPKRDSLWPAALAKTAGMDFKRFLDDQAADLKRLVKDAFNVEVESRIVENVFIYNFTIVLPKQNYHYLLFSLRATSDELSVTAVRPGADVTLVPLGATWRYFDQRQDLGTAWRMPDYVDSAWKSGAARLGYGGDGEKTTINTDPCAREASAARLRS